MKHNGETMHGLLNTMGIVAKKDTQLSPISAMPRQLLENSSQQPFPQLQYKMARDPIHIYTYLKDERLSVLDSNLNNPRSLTIVPVGGTGPLSGAQAAISFVVGAVVYSDARCAGGRR